MTKCSVPLMCVALLTPALRGQDPQQALVGHWKLAGDSRDYSGNGNHAKNHDVEFTAARTDARPAGLFNGHSSYLEIPASPSLKLGKQDFTIAAWVHSDKASADIPGDIVSQYDPARRRGFHLTLKTNAGVTFNHANDRHLQFSIDDNRTTPWTDCGRPGNAILAFALAVHEGQLYGGAQRWIDCGSPCLSNSVTAMAVHDGSLFAGSGKYRLGGSALPESENPNLGGKVFRYDRDQRWIECGQLPGVEAVGGMVVFRGRLYASALYRPAGFFRYEGGTRWTSCGTPDGKRVEALGIYNGFLYATSYDGGRVYRFDGTAWTDCGQLGDPKENTQTYSIAVHHGRLYVGTWRSGRVYRFEDVDRWTDVGRLGQELEVMGMLVHNGRLLAGTLPLAEIYEHQGDSKRPSEKGSDPLAGRVHPPQTVAKTWESTGGLTPFRMASNWKRLVQLDATPDVRYRRAWTLAEHQGRVFCSTLPSGHIYAFAAGAGVAWERQFPEGWHHVAAVKTSRDLKLFVDGKLVSRQAIDAADYDLSTAAPLYLGKGANDSFNGRLRDVRLYRRALSAKEISSVGGITE
jgi:hypothetical protein